MATPIRIKRSAQAGKKPTLEQLQLGELAVNFYDGKVFFKQDTQGVGIGTRIVEIGAGSTTFPGKVIFVTDNGNDDNNGLDENNAKATIKAAAALALPGDTIKVFSGRYVENNPITLADNVTIVGNDIRNCLIEPQNNADVIHLGNGGTVQDLSFVGNFPLGSDFAVISYRPLLGVSSDRFFDAARLIRQNIDFIAAETAGYISSTAYQSPALSIDVNEYRTNIKNAMRGVCHDITRGGNSKSIGVGLSYFTGEDLNVGIGTTNIDALNYSIGIARSCVNNVVWGGNYQNDFSQVRDLSIQEDGATGSNSDYGSCANVHSAITVCVGLVTGIIGNGLSTDLFDRVTKTVTDGILQNQTVITGINTDGIEEGFELRPISQDGTQVIGTGHTVVSIGSSQITINPASLPGSYEYANDDIIFANRTTPPLTGFTINYPGNNGQINSGILDSSLSPSQGVGIIKKGPYIRNCTNFISNSIGARVDGFNSDEGDEVNTSGVQGSFNVDAFTQYNQGGIGVSVTNGSYAQLVSLFTICNDTAVYVGSGGQCDLTNSNSSFGTRGLVADGIGDANSKCSDRYTGVVNATSPISQNIVEVSGIGNNRPYNGQAVYFNRKYYAVNNITITNPGSGYGSTPPVVTIDEPTGPGIAIQAQATATVSNGQVTDITLTTGGSQYESVPNVTIEGNAEAEVTIEEIYFTVSSATEPVAGVSTVTLVQNLNNEVGLGSTVFFARQSFQIVSSHSFQYIGAGNTIENAYPSRGGTTIQENEVVKIAGGDIAYTSTDQAGNFRIGDGVVIDQATGSISGNIYVKSLFSQVTPFILALGGD